MRKINLEYVRQSFAAKGYELLATEYKNARIPLKFTCPNGHTHQIAWKHWNSGSICVFCVGNAKNTLDTVRESFYGKGYQLLSPEYINAHTPLKVLCPEKHVWEVPYNRWQQGARCGVCAGRYITIEEVKKAFEKEGYIVVSLEYVSAKDKIEFICPEGHLHSMSWDSWQRGTR